MKRIGNYHVRYKMVICGAVSLITCYSFVNLTIHKYIKVLNNANVNKSLKSSNENKTNYNDNGNDFW